MSQGRHQKLFKSKEMVKHLQFYRLASHLTIENQRVIYHFKNEHDANIFLKSAQSKFWAKDFIQKTKCGKTRCSHGENYQRCITIGLTPTQFDTLVSENGFAMLSKLNSALNRNDRQAIESLSFHRSILINQAALLITKGKKENNILHYLRDNVFDNFISHVEEDVLLQILKLKLNKISIFKENLYFLSYLMFEIFKKILNNQEIDMFITEQIMEQKSHAPVITIHEKQAIEALSQISKEMGGKDKVNEYISSHYDVISKNPFVLHYLKQTLNDKTLNDYALQIVTNKHPNNPYIADFLFENYEKLKPELLGILNYLYPCNAFPHYASSFSSKATSAMFEYAEKWQEKIKENSLLNLIEFFNGAISKDHWTDLASEVLQIAPAVFSHKLTLDPSHQIQETKCEKLKKISIREFCNDQLKFHDLTRDMDDQLSQIVLKDITSGNYVILRLQGKDEPLQTLVNEYKSARFLKDHAEQLSLKSYIPESLGITQISGILRWIKDKINAVHYSELCDFLPEHSLKYGVYISTISQENKNFLQYLHDPELSEKEFNESNRKVVNDLFTLMKQGMIIQPLANLFHNTQDRSHARRDKGRYFVLADLLRNLEMGSGRLDNWQSCVLRTNANIRVTGLVNLNHHISFHDLIGEATFLNKYHNYAKNAHLNFSINYILANIMAEYQYVLFLISGIRGIKLTEIAKKEGKTADEIHAIWKSLAKQIIQNSALGASIITQKSENEIEKLFSIFIDGDRLARQMQYWMNNEYIEDIMQDKVREDIYAKDTHAVVDFRYFKKNTFNTKAGFSFNGINSDLGTFNGQEPIKEANKLFHFMVTYIFTQYSKLYLTLHDMHRTLNDKDIYESEKSRQSRFKHLYGKTYHTINKNICQERLAQKNSLPDDIKENIQKELEHHKREEASYRIAEFWRKHKKIKSNDTEMKVELTKKF